MMEPANRLPVSDSEESGFPVRRILWVAAGLTFTAILIFAVNALLLHYLAGGAATASAGRPDAQVPAQSAAETGPDSELARLRAREDQLLTTYGWIDRDRRIVRIPIEQAMQIIAQRANTK